MPSLFPGFEYDLFVSYRQKDNKYDGWVTQFVANLRKELEATFKEDISIYFDENPNDGLLETHHVDKSLEGKLKCLIFIPIISQTYCDTKSFAWQQEFCAFNKLAKEDLFGRDIKLSNGNVASRILPVKIHGLDSGDQKALETEIGTVLRAVEFIYKEPGVNRPLSPDDDPSENLNRTKYRNQVNKVANAVKEIIEGLKNFGHPEFHSPSKERLSEETKSSTGKSIIVLPFENMSPEKDQEYFSDGLTEEIITNLSRISSLKVLSRTSSMHYKSTKKPLKEIAKELGVEYVLEGSVRKQGKDLRITAQLIEAAIDAHLWADKYRGTLEDVFDIQEKVAEEIVRALELQLTDTEDQALRIRHTKNTDAHDFYLKGYYHLWMLTPENVSKAIEYFQRAIETDEHYAPAYAGLAMSFNGAAWTGYMDQQEAFSKAKRFATRAVEIDDTLAEAHATLGYNYCLDWKWSQAEQQYKRAIELKSNYADAHLYYTWHLGAVARIDEAMDEVKKAQQLDPLSPIISANVSFPYYWKRQHDQAITQCLFAIKLDPTFYLSYWFLGIAYASSGHHQEAISSFQKAVKFSGDGPYYLGWLGNAYAAAGYKQEALKIVEELKQLSTPKKTFSYQIALVYLGLGDSEQAMHWLEQAYDERAPLLWYLKIDPYLDPLRSNTRFNAMLIGMGLAKDVRHVSEPPNSDTPLREKSIVVLPFENMSSDKENEYFSDGLTEEIITNLSRISSLKVLSRTSSMHYKGARKPLAQIAKELGVEYVLEGSVRKQGKDVRITAQLIEAGQDVHLWTEMYDRRLKDIFAIQSDIALRVAESLKASLTKEEAEKIQGHPTESVEAYDYYLLGQHHWFRFTEEGVKKAGEFFSKALSVDPDFAPAHAGLANTYLMRGGAPLNVLPASVAMPVAKREAERSIKLNPNFGWAYEALALVQCWFELDWKAAQETAKRGTEVDPNSSLAWAAYGGTLDVCGEHEDAIRAVTRALELDPLSGLILANVAWAHYDARQYDKAEQYSHRLLKLIPNFPPGVGGYCQILLAQGKNKEAYALIEPMSKVMESYDYGMAILALALGRSGHTKEAIRLAKKLELQCAEGRASWADVALAYLGVGDSERAFEFLEKVPDQRPAGGQLTAYLGVSPLFDSIRQDKRYQHVLQRLGFPQSILSLPSNEVLFTSNEKSIIVLPFENMSPDKDNEYFSDGLTEEIIADLSKVQELSVISRSSAMTFKGTKKKIKEIAEDVNVRYVLEGSVRKEGNNLRITAQLIDGTSDVHVWSEKYAGTLDHVFEIQEKLSRSIVAALKVQLSTGENEELTKRPIANLRAYECYLHAKKEYSTNSKEGFDRALSLTREALQLEGDNELLFGTIASIYYGMWFSGFVDPGKNHERETKACMESAFKLNPKSPQGYFAAGVLDYMQGKRQDAVRNFKLILKTDPSNSATMLILGTIYLDVGRAEAADPVLQHLLALDPLTAINQGMVGYLEWQQGRFQVALPYWKRAYELEPEVPPNVWSYACALASAGKKDEALQVIGEMVSAKIPGPFTIMAQLLRCGLTGKKEAAIKLLTPEFVGFAKSLPFVSRDLAGYLGMVGLFDEAFNYVENAINLGYINYPFLALHHPFYGTLRSHPRFTKLMDQIKPQWEAFEV